MSYITERLLTQEFQRLLKEAGINEPEAHIHDRDNDRPRHPFTAIIGDKEIKFTVPEDRLHSSPLSFVSRDYLAPLLAKIAYLERHAPPP